MVARFGATNGRLVVNVANGSARLGPDSPPKPIANGGPHEASCPRSPCRLRGQRWQRERACPSSAGPNRWCLAGNCNHHVSRWRRVLGVTSPRQRWGLGPFVHLFDAKRIIDQRVADGDEHRQHVQLLWLPRSPCAHPECEWLFIMQLDRGTLPRPWWSTRPEVSDGQCHGDCEWQLDHGDRSGNLQRLRQRNHQRRRTVGGDQCSFRHSSIACS
jgi:hypothetical protein